MAVILSCSHYDEIQKNGKESQSHSSESHNQGMDCMSCHHEQGNEAYDRWWYVAGTVFLSDGTPAPSSGAIELWTKPGRSGEKIYTLQIDAKGNFYTQKIIDFKGGVYPVLVANSGTITAMSTSTLNLACNSCHGISTERLTVN